MCQQGYSNGDAHVCQSMTSRPVDAGADALKTPADAVDRIHELATTSTYTEIAAQLNAEGWKTAFGRSFTSQHVGYICRRDGVAQGAAQMRLTPKRDLEKIH
jgi:hypothetical protein